jgi:hypothetical protein
MLYPPRPGLSRVTAMRDYRLDKRIPARAGILRLAASALSRTIRRLQ